MQEKLKKVTSETTGSDGKVVTLSIQSQLFLIKGTWQWDMNSEALYCSDVMSFPRDFTGTKGIIHPDDLFRVQQVLEAAQQDQYLQFQFRLITTYGEVKTISGDRLTIDDPGEEDAVPQPEAEVHDTAIRFLMQRKEAESLQLRSSVTDVIERLQNMGSWIINKTTGEAWYSDQVFRIHGLPPQSLNAHFNTFQPFIHPDDYSLVTEAFDAAYEKELPLHFSYRVLRNDGQPCLVQQISQWVFSAKGEKICCGILRDLTEEQARENEFSLTQESLQLQQQVLRFSEQQGSTGHWYLNLATRKVVFSDNYLRIYGVKQPILANHTTFVNQVHPEDREKVQAAIEEMYRQHTISELEFRIIRADGKQRQLRQTGRLVHQGSDLFILGVVQDLTVQKSLEKKITEANDSIALGEQIKNHWEELAGVSALVWNSDGQMSWSDGVYRLLGYKPGLVEPMLRLIQKTVHPEDLNNFKEAVSIASKGTLPEEFSFRMISRWGFRHMKLSFRQITWGGKECVVGILQDITTQETTVQKLQDLQHYNDLLQDTIQDTLILTNANHQIISWTSIAEKKTGLKKEQALHQNLFDVFPDLNDELFLGRLQQVLLGEEVQAVSANAGYVNKPHQYSLVPFRNEKEVIGVLHLVQDTSKELELQRRLNERLNFIESLVEASVDRIVVLDQHMNYLYWNKKAEEYYAINKERIIGKNILEIFPGFRNDPSYQEFRKVLKGETVHIPATNSQEGTGYFETWLTPIQNDRGEVTAVLWVVHDLGREFQLQEVERKAQQKIEIEHQRLKEAQAIGHVGSFEWEAASDTIYWSDEMYRIHGLEPQSEAITLERLMSFIHPQDAEGLRNAIMQCRTEPTTTILTQRIVLANGDIRTVTRHVRSFADAEGQVTHLSGTLQDITDQVAAQQELEQNRDLLRRTEDVIHIGSYEADLLTNAVHFSDGMFRLFGEEPQSFEPTLAFIDSRSHPDDVAMVQAALAQAALDKQAYHYIRRIYRKDGVERTVEAHGKVISNEKGKAVKFLGLVQDITERRKSEELLRQQTHYLRRITETVPDMMSVLELSSQEFHYLNKEVFVAHGFDPDLMAQQSKEELDAMIHPDDKQRLSQFFQRLSVASDDEVAMAEYRARTFSDEWKWFLVRGKVFQRNEEGVVTHILNAIENITTRKTSEQEIIRLKSAIAQKATDKYLTLFNSIDEGFYQGEVIFDAANQPADILFLEENPAAIRIMGQSFVGKTLKQISPGYESHWFEVGGQVALTGESKRVELYSEPDKKWFNSYITKVGNEESRQIAIVFHDLTDRKRAEEALYELNNRLVSVLESTTDAFYAVDANFNVTYVNKRAAQLWQRSPESLLGKHYWTEFPNAVGSESYKKHYEAFEKGAPTHYETVSPLVGIWIDVSIFPGEYGGLSVFFRDITERKKAEEQLKNFAAILEQQIAERTADLSESQKLLQTIYDNVPLGLAIHEPVYTESDAIKDFRIRFVNGELERLTGRSDLAGKLYSVEFPGIRAKGLFDLMVKTMESGEMQELEYFYPHESFNQWFHSRFIRTGDFLVATNENVTQQKKAEETLKKNFAILQQSEELTGIGSWEYDIASGKFIWSEGMYRLFNLENGQPVRPDIYLSYAVKSDKAVAKRIVQHLQQDFEAFEETLRIDTGGGVRTLKLKSSVEKDEEGKPSKIVGVDLDITEEVKANETLQEHTHFIEKIARTTPDVITIYNLKEQKISYINHLPQELLGFTKEELVGFGKKLTQELLHPDDLSLWPAQKKDIMELKEGEVKEQVSRLKDKSSNLHYINSKSTVFKRDEKGKIADILTISRDVTSEYTLQKELIKRSLFVEALVDNSIDRIMAFDKDFVITAWNRRCEAIYGIKKEEAIGQVFFALFPKVKTDQDIIEAMNKAQGGEMTHLPVIKEIYKEAYAEVFFIPLKNEQDATYGILNIMHDVTKVQQAKEELRALNRTLKQRNIELQRRNEEVASFAFVASHDLREPIRKMHTFSDWLLQRESPNLSELGKSYVERMVASVKRLDSLIHDILALTQIHTEREQKEKLALKEVVAAVEEEMKESIEANKAVIEVGALPVVNGIRQQLLHLFRNLLSNALKFQKGKPRITIKSDIIDTKLSTQAELPEGQYHRISVTDNGIGFSPKYKHKVFEIFQRLNTQMYKDGTGIGLAICKKVMENHSGYITVDTEEGRGATFCCYFPLQAD